MITSLILSACLFHAGATNYIIAADGSAKLYRRSGYVKECTYEYESDYGVDKYGRYRSVFFVHVRRNKVLKLYDYQ